MSLKISPWLFSVLTTLAAVSAFAPPALVYSYAESSYYSQPYYQSNYQTYYQGSYQTTFTGDVSALDDFSITSAISKAYGTFMIDYPLDPKNKLLFHSFVESPDIKNLYDGIITLNERGEAWVTLPNYFEALNKDFRYQLKALDAPSPNLYIKEEIKNNGFIIGGGTPGSRISWQVTGIRKDAYALANPIRVEVTKGPSELVDVGEYLFEGYKPSLSLDVLFSGFSSVMRSWFGR